MNRWDHPADYAERHRIVANDDRPNLYAQFRPSAPASRFRRLCDWLEDTYSGPRGLAWFVGTLFPICAALFALVWFGGRTILKAFGL